MPTIGSMLTSSALRTPDRTALVYGETRRTYAQLEKDVNRVAHALARLGLTKGDRFALMAGNSDKFVIAFYAATKLGALVVPINPRSAPPEVQYLLEDSGARMLAFDVALADVVHQAMGDAPSADTVLLALEPMDGYTGLEEMAVAESEENPDVDVNEWDDSLILYTSGTTGRPKGALFDHHRSVWVGVSMCTLLGISDGDRLLHVAPLYHAAELTMMLIPGTMVGGTHVILREFDPGTVLKVFEEERITSFFGVPTMYQFLLRHPDLSKRDLSAWRMGLFGAAPMAASTAQQLVEKLPGVSLFQACGQTEGGPGGIYCRPEEVAANPGASGRTSLLNTVARVVDPDDHDVSPGEVGELILQGETVMKGYWNKPAETDATIRDGWLHTGDLAKIDADGYITLVDRMKDMIITGGRNVYSVEVENALGSIKEIADCAVVGRKNEEYGETIVAVVNFHPGQELTLEQVREQAGKLIADYKLPRELIVAEIPRNPSGKILKHKVRAALNELSGV